MTVFGWYTDRVDGLATIDSDPDNDQIFSINISGRYTGSVTDATAGTVVSEGGSLTASVTYFDDDVIQFRGTGAGGVVPITVSYGSGEFDQFSVRIRQVNA